MKNDIVLLIAEEIIEDDIGQQIPIETSREVFCGIRSISRAEWYDAGRSGMKPSFAVIVDYDDYQGETVAEHSGKRYGIYRTYSADQKEIELYLEERAGI